MLLGTGEWGMLGNGVVQCHHGIDITSVFSEGLIHIYLLDILLITIRLITFNGYIPTGNEQT